MIKPSWMSDCGNALLFNDDCLNVLRGYDGANIAAVITSPPYGVGKKYEEKSDYLDYECLIRKFVRASQGCLCRGGWLCVNTNDRLCSSEVSDGIHLAAPLFAEECNRRGLQFYDRRIWVKDPCWMSNPWHGSSFKSVDESEMILIFRKRGATGFDRLRLQPEEWTSWGSRGVWSIPSVRKNNDHPAKFPDELASRMVRLYSAPGESVLDPFMGSGTTGVACIKTGRKFIGIELDRNYFNIAVDRIKKALAEHPIESTAVAECA